MPLLKKLSKSLTRLKLGKHESGNKYIFGGTKYGYNTNAYDSGGWVGKSESGTILMSAITSKWMFWLMVLTFLFPEILIAYSPTVVHLLPIRRVQVSWMNLKNQLLTGDSAAINATWMTLTRLSRM
jgi:hypothetical protein